MALAIIIELIAVGPGSGIHDAWGTCALRVIDPRDNSDQVYGEERSHYVDAIRAWSQADRTITRRTLTLPEDQAASLAERLESAQLMKGEQLADELDRALGGMLRSQGNLQTRGTLRSAMLDPLRRQPFVYVGLDLVMTSTVDRPVTLWESRFLCERFAELVDRTKLVSNERDEWVSSSIDSTAIWSWPWIVVYTLFLAPLLLLALFRPLWTELIWALIGGAAGAIILALGSMSIPLYAFGWNLFVVPPAHILVLNRRWRFQRTYWIAHAIVLAAIALVPSARGALPAIGVALPLAIVLAWKRRRV